MKSMRLVLAFGLLIVLTLAGDVRGRGPGPHHGK